MTAARGAPPPRSYLFVPGDRPERFDKAHASAADAVILDLEDAVAPDRKDAARASVAAALSASRPVVLRINPVDTPWFRADLALCRHPGVAAVMLPKSERVQDLAGLGADLAVIALIETAAGFANVRAIAAAANVRRLAFGAIDFQLDLGLRASFDDLLAFRSEIVLAARLAMQPAPIDSPSVAIDAPAEVEEEARRARRIGFGAKLCIHPRQVDVVNRSFSPSDAELAWAERVMEAADRSQGAAVALDGKMMDKPVILRAQALLRERR
jgi:citrate lyase subunit beta/citryl-CoA lyase